MRTVAFILKRVPGMCFGDAAESSLYDPSWALHWGEKNNTNLRFTGVLSPTEWMYSFRRGILGELVPRRPHAEWMKVLCDDERCPELHGKHVVWKMHNTYSSIKRYWACGGADVDDHTLSLQRGGSRTFSAGDGHGAVAYLNTGEDIIIIRPCMFEVLRAVVMFRCLLARVRLRARRKTFIRGTHWADKNCALSRFSGTINTPVKQRICAFI